MGLVDNMGGVSIKRTFLVSLRVVEGAEGGVSGVEVSPLVEVWSRQG
jgi:hypothetical protein